MAATSGTVGLVGAYICVNSCMSGMANFGCAPQVKILQIRPEL
jgi:hypothetical protein